jgi:hypothetical protein
MKLGLNVLDLSAVIVTGQDVFALRGKRALYFFVAGAVQRFRYHIAGVDWSAGNKPGGKFFTMTASVSLGGGRTADRRRRALGFGRLLRSRTAVGSAYKGAWVGLAVGAVLAIIEPWSYVAAGAIGAGCFVGGAVAGAGLHLILARRFQNGSAEVPL